MATPGRPGIRVIAERFGVNPSTVQRISRPFDGASVAVALPLGARNEALRYLLLEVPEGPAAATSIQNDLGLPQGLPGYAAAV